MGSNLSVIESETLQSPQQIQPKPSSLRAFCRRIGLLVVSTLLLNYSFSPFNQFYLAWFALVPLLLVLKDVQGIFRAFFWGWLAGVLFFTASLTWMWHTTFAGTVTLIVYCALWWGLGASVTVCSNALHRISRSPVSAIIAIWIISCIWVAQEWIRVTLFTGFPWVPLGQSQSPFIQLCQIADITGVFGLSFCIVAINGAILVWVLRPAMKIRVASSGAVLLLVIAGSIYGSIRLSAETKLGPRLMVVQPNFPHERGGKRIVTFDQLEKFHFDITRSALAADRADLVVWSETALPPMNLEARRMTKDKHLAFEIHDNLLSLVRANRTSLIFGAYALVKFTGDATEADIRNSTYFYSSQSNEQPRYDKIHLVPFGEIVPFKHSWPWAYRMFMKFAAYSVEYTISPGPSENPTIFELPTSSGRWKFITPICFEDTDGALIAKLLRPKMGEAKQADFLVNISNDGWFNQRQKWQHLQHAVFRCIENRVPMARSCNTGMSGFTDPFGREISMIEPNKEGVQFADLPMLAHESLTLYTRFGNVFAWMCTAVSAGAILFEFIRRRRKIA